MNKENTVLGFSLAPLEHTNTEDLSLSVDCHGICEDEGKEQVAVDGNWKQGQNKKIIWIPPVGIAELGAWELGK